MPYYIRLPRRDVISQPLGAATGHGHATVQAHVLRKLEHAGRQGHRIDPAGVADKPHVAVAGDWTFKWHSLGGALHDSGIDQRGARGVLQGFHIDHVGFDQGQLRRDGRQGILHRSHVGG